MSWKVFQKKKLKLFVPCFPRSAYISFIETSNIKFNQNMSYLNAEKNLLRAHIWGPGVVRRKLQPHVKLASTMCHVRVGESINPMQT